MVGVHAFWIIATVANIKLRRRRPKFKFPRDTMRAKRGFPASVACYAPVPAFVHRTLPFPTIIGRCYSDFWPEAICNGFWGDGHQNFSTHAAASAAANPCV